MKIRGMSGWWLKQVNIPPTGPGVLVQHNAEYELLVEADLREARTVGSGGYAEGLLRFKRVEHARFKVADDDPFHPEAIGLVVGAEVTVWLKRGELNEYDKLERAIVQSVRKMNDQKKARWLEVVCKYGTYIRSSTPPGLARGSQPLPDEEPVIGSGGTGQFGGTGDGSTGQ